MTFDPNIDPEDYAASDAYVLWCLDNLRRVTDLPRTYRTGVRAAAWTLVIATAHLRVTESALDHDALADQLDQYRGLARAIERQREHYDLDRLVLLRASLDCWAAMNVSGSASLHGAKIAASALILIEAHPLVDLWDLQAPDVWTLLLSVPKPPHIVWSPGVLCRDESVTAKFTWQRANNIARHVGAENVSPN